jgi:hypothetical protein
MRELLEGLYRCVVAPSLDAGRRGPDAHLGIGQQQTRMPEIVAPDPAALDNRSLIGRVRPKGVSDTS